MTLSTWPTYFFTTIVLSISPGPGVFSSISSGMHYGFRKGVWNGVGMQAANLIHLGIASWRAPAKGFEEEAGDNAATTREIFKRGFWVNATNPKGIIFFAAILPQFIDVTRAQLSQYALFATTTFTVNRGIGSLFVAASVALASFRRIASAAA